MDLLEWGAEWLAEQAKTHASFKVTLVYNDIRTEISASLVDEQGRVIPQEVKLRTEFTKFLFNTGELLNCGVPIRRGLIIEWGSKKYEVVINGARIFNYNDSYRKTIVVETKHVSD